MLQYDDSEDKEKVPKVYKRRQINESEDEKKQDLPADYKNDEYILLPALKILNCPVNLRKGTRSLSKKYQVKY